MNRNHFWKLVLVLFLLLWAVYEIYPPTSRDLVEYFKTEARHKDAAFTNIIAKAEELQKARPDLSYGNLRDAAGTNDLTRYFDFRDAKNQEDPTAYVLNELQRGASGRIKLGLDLRGGVSFLMKMDTNRLENTQSTGAALSQAVEVLRRRVDKFGVAEPVIQPVGNDQILVQLPGLSAEQTESAKKQLSQAAFLEFRMVHPDSANLIKEGIVPPGCERMRVQERNRPGEKQQSEELIVKKKPERGFTGAYIASAYPSRDQLSGRAEIIFKLNSEGAAIFRKITSENIGQRLAIVLDGQLRSAPVIQSEISAEGNITGDFTDQEAQDLANVLENPLKAPLSVISSQAVDPTLGKDSVRSGMYAAIIGVIAVAVFMLVYYFLAGLVANVALMLNIIILLGMMCFLETTFTLPGIAGVVLTIGMAVDANVLIYERIREELAAGKSMRGALNAGYNKAFGTIFDSNLTTLISSVILYFLGTGPVKGFGITLTWGVLISMFTALVVTRLIFDWLLAKNILKNLPMLHIIRGAKIDFMKWAVPAFVASWLLIVVGNGYGLFVRGHDVLGVELAGGDNITFNFDPAHRIEVDKLRAAAVKASGGDVLVAYQHDVANAKDSLRVTVRDFGGGSSSLQGGNVSSNVVAQLQQQFPEANLKPSGTDHIGPTVGKQIRDTAIISSLLAMFGILVYVAFRYEFSFAVGAVIAIIHDILMTLGWYFLAGRELNATTVAAILTIIGFSINDTIVIFDRIREDLKLGVRGTFREVLNQALNQTLSRTIITSGTVFLATLSLFIFGGGPINDFAFTFLVGILTGTYSSIYIASALVLWWHKGQRPKIGVGQLNAESAVPARA